MGKDPEPSFVQTIYVSHSTSLILIDSEGNQKNTQPGSILRKLALAGLYRWYRTQSADHIKAAAFKNLLRNSDDVFDDFFECLRLMPADMDPMIRQCRYVSLKFNAKTSANNNTYAVVIKDVWSAKYLAMIRSGISGVSSRATSTFTEAHRFNTRISMSSVLDQQVKTSSLTSMSMKPAISGQSFPIKSGWSDKVWRLLSSNRSILRHK